ncbi:MAG: hypothetical protein PVI71_00395 [Desulfobacterales bacterium]
MKKFTIIFIIVLLPAVASANFSIRFENTSSEKMIYSLFWIDHPFKSLRPANMAAGELKALESRRLSYHYISGQYYIVWRDDRQIRHEMLIYIHDDVTHITVTPQNWSTKAEEL